MKRAIFTTRLLTACSPAPQWFEVDEQFKIQLVASASGISLMPEGLEQGLNCRKLADLIAFLQGQPGAKKAAWVWWRK